MKYRNLGNSGLKVSEIGLGTNNFGTNAKFPFHMRAAEAATIIDAALDVGINMIDTANVYGTGKSEEYVGKALRGKRDKAIIATKVRGPMRDGPHGEGLSRKSIFHEIEASLKRLQTDYVDLYQLHWVDKETSIEETLRALDDLVKQGKVRYIGCSNYEAWRLCETVWTSKSLNLTSIVSTQPAYSLLDRDIEAEVMPFCEEYNIGIIPYYPLANGLLTGKYKRNQPPPKGSRLEAKSDPYENANFDVIESLEGFAVNSGHTILELAFAWLLSKVTVSSVIAGATKVEQIQSNAAATDWVLTTSELSEISELLGDGVSE